MKLPARSCRPRCPAQGARTPLARQCRRPSHRRPCAAQASTTDEEDLAGWQEFFDSDDLALPDDAIPAELRGLVRQPKGNATPPSTPVVTGHCYGCGLNLQTDHPDGLGYVEAGLYRQKRAHRQQNEVLCSRCVALSHGKMVPAVEDFSQKQALLERSGGAVSTSSSDEARPGPAEELLFKGDRLLTAEQLRAQLEGIRDTKAVVVMIIDLLDASGSFLTRLRNIVGSNPVIVIATKVDLLPKGTDLDRVHQWLQDFVAFKRLTCLSIHVVSNKTGAFMDNACRSILSQRQGRDVYIVGAANVGKSAFVRRVLSEMSSAASQHFDAQAGFARRHLPMESAMPGTTLGRLRLAAFSSGGALFDTPGLHLHNRLLHSLRPAELKAIHPRRRLRPYVAASPLTVAEETGGDDDGGPVVPCATYLWGALLRVDVVSAGADVRLVFFGTGAMEVRACQLLDEDCELALAEYAAGQEAGADFVDPVFAARSVADRGGLRLARTIDLAGAGEITTLTDICVAGLPGWVAVVSGAGDEPLKMRLWTPRGVEVHVRPPIPCPTPVSVAQMEWS